MSRPHHYQFAHSFMPAYFFSSPDSLFELLKEDGRMFLHYLWENEGKKVDEALPFDLKLERHIHNKYEIFLITMPPPEEATEAFYIFMAANKSKYFYHTLELATSLDNPQDVIAMKCEWNANGEHLNQGVFPSFDLEDFLARCLKDLS